MCKIRRLIFFHLLTEAPTSGGERRPSLVSVSGGQEKQNKRVKPQEAESWTVMETPRSIYHLNMYEHEQH